MNEQDAKSRFSISGIRDGIELQKSIDIAIEVEKKEKIAQAKKIALEKKQLKEELKQLQERERKIFIDEYGRKLLESAIKGETNHKFYNLRSAERNLIEKRGFNVFEQGMKKLETLDLEQLSRYRKSHKTTVQKISDLSEDVSFDLRNKIINIFNSDYAYFSLLNTLIPQLKSDFKNEDLPGLLNLGFKVAGLPRYAKDPIPQEIKSLKVIVSMYEDDKDEAYISQQSVSWLDPDDFDESIRDCIKAKFLDWLSDDYGKKLISLMFSLIESSDLDGKKEARISIGKHSAMNEDMHDELKNLIQLFDIDIPFSLTTIRSMFDVLNYTTEFIKNSNEAKNVVGDLIVRWS